MLKYKNNKNIKIIIIICMAVHYHIYAVAKTARVGDKSIFVKTFIIAESTDQQGNYNV
jgi:hypothetical protein